MNDLAFLYIPDLVNNHKHITDLYKNLEKSMVVFDSLEGKDNNFLVCKFEDLLLESIIKNIVGNISFNLRFYKQYKNKNHEIHKDVGGVLCTLNYLIEGYDAPVIFYNDDKAEIGRYHYQCGLLNVQKFHSVPYSSKDRVFLRFAFKQSYDEMKEIFKNYETIPYQLTKN